MVTIDIPIGTNPRNAWRWGLDCLIRRPGGWTHSFTFQDYRLSPGVHYIGDLQEGGGLRRIYDGLGVSQDLTDLETRRKLPGFYPRMTAIADRDTPRPLDKLVKGYIIN